MADIALMPEGHVFHRGERVGAHEPRQTGNIFRQNRVTLVRHRRRAFLPRGKGLLSFLDFGALQMADFYGKFLQRAGNNSQGCEIIRVAIALNDLVGNRRGLKAALPAHIGLDPW